MTAQTPPTASSGRLELRPFRATDRAGYEAYHRLPEVYRFLYTPVPDTEALDAQFAEALSLRLEEDGDVMRLAVIRRADDALLGEVLLKMASKAALQGEIGYIFNPAFAGAGYATEAVRMMLDLGFGRCGFHRIFARLDPLNHGSVGVVERLQLRREAHFRQNDRFNGSWGDEYVYALTKDEWQGPGG